MANPRPISSYMDQQQLHCWERFFHKKTITVLLVETDDSARKVITTLLHCCMYQVIPAENGHQAWEYLRAMQRNIDLVLTEVDVSGIELLERIMDHSVCKNIPVITMSCYDSMDTVFNCLSKGAVDFLVKPVRVNELKNLWQHVWRRCKSSCLLGFTQNKTKKSCVLVTQFSGSASRIQTHKCTKPNSGVESNKNTGSNDRNDDTTEGLGARDGSGNGSGTKRSWTKRAVEIDHGFLITLSTMENLEEPIVRTADLIGSMAKNMEARAKYAPNCSSKVPDGKDTKRDDVVPWLELSLKRPISSGDDANAMQEEKRNVLRRSGFTRYNRCAASNQGGAGFVGSCSTHGNSSEAVKTDNMNSSSDAGVMKQGSNVSSNNNDLGSTTKKVVTKPGGKKVSHQWQPVAAGKDDKADELGKKNAAGGKEKAGEAESKRPCAVHDENGRSARVPQTNVTDPWAPVEDGSNSGTNNNTDNGSTAATAVNVEAGGTDIMYLKGERRAVAVNRYREKRKELNFGKKVRYESRKKLAEQRPRVRGQFVPHHI